MRNKSLLETHGKFLLLLTLLNLITLIVVTINPSLIRIFQISFFLLIGNISFIGGVLLNEITNQK